MSSARPLLLHAARAMLLVLLAACGTLTLVRYAPGYFAGSSELDAQHAEVARQALAAERRRAPSALAMALSTAQGWFRGGVQGGIQAGLGVSRQYQVPVWQLLRPRLPVTLSLLARSIALGWLSALALALPLSALKPRAGKRADPPIALGSALSLAIPIGALATLFLVTDTGGPALAIALGVAARDFKFLYRLLRHAWLAPHLLHARALGISTRRIVWSHLAPALAPQLAAIATMSFVLALSLDVPAEVIFDVPGLGQLAWSAATNRDAPVLVAVTLLMAASVSLSGSLSAPASQAAAPTSPAPDWNPA